MKRKHVRVTFSSSSPKSLYSLFFFSGSGVVSLAGSEEPTSFSTVGSDIGVKGRERTGRGRPGKGETLDYASRCLRCGADEGEGSGGEEEEEG